MKTFTIRFYSLLAGLISVVMLAGQTTTAATLTVGPEGQYSTIQAAVNAAEAGDTIEVALGEYCENVVIDRGVNIIGHRSGWYRPYVIGMFTVTDTSDVSKTFKNIDFYFNEEDINSLKLIAVQNLTVESCNFDGDTRYNDDAEIQVVAVQLNSKRIDGVNTHCKGIRFLDCGFWDGHNVTIQGNIDDLLVENCSITGNKSGINIQNSYGAGLTVRNTLIQVFANAPDVNAYCIRFGSSSGTAVNMSIEGGTFIVDKGGFTPDEGKIMQAIVLRSQASGTLSMTGASVNGEIGNLTSAAFAIEDCEFSLVIVDKAFNESTPGFGEYLSNTIQGGVDLVAEGGTVEVAAGTYEENVAISSPASIVARDVQNKPLVVGMFTLTETSATSKVIKNINFKVNASDKNNLLLAAVKNLTVESCDFDGANRFMDTPEVVAVQLNKARIDNVDHYCENIVFNDCAFHDGYYVTIQGRTQDLTVKDSSIANCKSGINMQYSYGDGVTVKNTDISVVAQGAENDTYAIRFGSAGGIAQNLSIEGGTFAVDNNGLTPVPNAKGDKTYFAALILRQAASGSLNMCGTTFNGEIANFSSTRINATACNFGVVVVDDKFYQSPPVDNNIYAFWRLQDGVNAVAEGGTVLAAAGTYTEDDGCVVDKQVTVKGANAGIPAGSTAGVRDDAESLVDGGFWITGDGALIDGFKIIWGYTREGIENHIFVDANNVTIANNIVVCKDAHNSSQYPHRQANGIENRAGSGNYLTIENNKIFGLFEGGSNIDAQRAIRLNAAEGVTIRGNDIHNNYWGVSSYEQMNLTLARNLIRDNRIGCSTEEIVSNIVVNENWFCNNSNRAFQNDDQQQPSKTVDITRNYWGHETGPAMTYSNPDGEGGKIGGNVYFSPFYADEELTSLVYAAGVPAWITGDLVVGAGEEVVLESSPLYLGDPEAGKATVSVNKGGRLVIANRMILDNLSSIEVVEGELVLGATAGRHTINGTFTIYNSFGSIYIAADTEFSGDTLALISDIHVADGVELTVSGSLTWDGCTVDCADEAGPIEGGSFSIAVTETGEFTMVRTELSDAEISLAGNGAEIFNNLLSNVAITVLEDAANNRIFHNIFAAAVTLNDNGTDTITEVDGWGNVASADEVKNIMAAELQELDGRTLEEGNLYIQPGDAVTVNLDAGALSRKVSSTVAMLGFNTDFFDADNSSLSGVAPWEYGLHNLFDADGVFGKINTALGLSIDFPDPVGTDEDGTAAEITLQTWDFLEDGMTRFYFRTWQEGDAPRATIRFSGFDFETGNDVILTPFTVNSGYIVVDGTAPEVADFSATQVQDATDVDIFTETATVHQGEITFTVLAQDNLAGIVDTAVVLTILHSDGETELAASFVSAVPAEDGWTTYTFTATIGTETPNGLYNATVQVFDRSGNPSETLEGSFVVQKNQAEITVELQGVAVESLIREVAFTATFADGSAPMVWVRELTFSAGIGSTTILEIPDGVVTFSAKTVHTLSRKLYPVQEDGQFIADFTDDKMLLGGDLNGDDVVDDLDFNRLRYYWYTESDVADITGDGEVGTGDLNVLKANFYKVGDSL